MMVASQVMAFFWVSAPCGDQVFLYFGETLN